MPTNAAASMFVWAVMPNGFSKASEGDSLQLSVLLSPRLGNGDDSDPLWKANQLGNRAFAILSDWPAAIAKLSFNVEFASIAGSSPDQVTAANFDPGGLDSKLWTTIFTSNLEVQAFVPSTATFADRQYSSYQVGPNYRNVVAGYHPDPGDLPAGSSPSAAALRAASKRRLARLVGASENDRQEIRARLDRLRHEHGAVAARHIAAVRGVDPDALHFAQMTSFYDDLASGAQQRYQDAQQRNFQIDPPRFDLHTAITALARYPALMRKLGLIIDLTIPFDPAFAAAAPGRFVRVTLPLPLPSWDSASPWTQYQLDPTGRRFFASPATDGIGIAFGLLEPRDSDTPMGLDLDGVAHGVHATLQGLHAQAARDEAAVPAAVLPAPRSAGLALARDSLASVLQGMLDHQRDLDADLADPAKRPAVTLLAEDMLSGFRVDIRAAGESGWRSLNRRLGTYRIADLGTLPPIEDEGCITLRTFNPESDNLQNGAAPRLWAHETLFRWTGWSLSVPRPGAPLDRDGKAMDPAQEGTSNLPLTVHFDSIAGSLPRLRFGRDYDCRLRAVDLAGNSIDPAADTDPGFDFHLGRYLRFDPLIAPVMLTRDPIDPKDNPQRVGESMPRLVIRGDGDGPTVQSAERWIAPPKVSAQMAEWHGMFDGAVGIDPQAYDTLIQMDGNFSDVPYGDNPPALPYLPDPLGRRAAFLVPTVPGVVSPPLPIVEVPFDGIWPRLQPFRLRLEEGDQPPAWDAPGRVLSFALPQGRMMAVDLVSRMDIGQLGNPPTGDQVQDLALFDFWESVTHHKNAPAFEQFFWNEMAAGRNEQLTPYREITLVHAVQRPVLTPQVLNASATAKNVGDTVAGLAISLTCDVASTGQLELLAEWDEAVDDGVNAPSRQTFKSHVIRRAIDYSEGTSFDLLGPQELYDTRHRRITYQVLATTRYREYFDNAIISDAANISRLSDKFTLDIPCSARPAPPKVLYVVPTFGWDESAAQDGSAARSRGSGLRIYLDRPWYSSGDGELLGAVIPINPIEVPLGNGDPGGIPPGEGPPPRPHQPVTNGGLEFPHLPPDPPPVVFVAEPPPVVTDGMAPFVTQWGSDPAYFPAQSDPVSSLTPLPQHFRNAKSVEFILTRAEENRLVYEQAVVTFDVQFEPPDPSNPGLPANPGRDPHNGRWFCDIEIEPGQMYFPFLRLALVRFQPYAIQPSLDWRDYRVSQPVLADFVQLTAGRTATIGADSSDASAVTVTVAGPSYQATASDLGIVPPPPEPLMQVDVQMDIGDAGAPVWVSASVQTLDVIAPTVEGAPFCSGQVPLPFARGSRAMRLIIREYEHLPADEGDRSRIEAVPKIASRLIYADTFQL